MLRTLGNNFIELLEEKHYTIIYDEEFKIKFRLGQTKTKKYLVIQSLYEEDIENLSFYYFQTKLTLKNLKEKSRTFSAINTMDEAFNIVNNVFEENKLEVKDIAKTKYLKLSLNFELKPLEINLPYKSIDNKLICQYFQIDESIFLNHENEEENDDENNEENYEDNINEQENEVENINIEDNKQININLDNNENLDEEQNEEIKNEEIQQVNKEIQHYNKKDEEEDKKNENEVNEEKEIKNEYKEREENHEIINEKIEIKESYDNNKIEELYSDREDYDENNNVEKNDNHEETKDDNNNLTKEENDDSNNNIIINEENNDEGNNNKKIIKDNVNDILEIKEKIVNEDEIEENEEKNKDEIILEEKSYINEKKNEDNKTEDKNEEEEKNSKNIDNVIFDNKINEELLNKIKILENDNISLKEQINKLKKELDKYIIEIKNLKKEDENNKNEIKNLKNENSTLKKINNELKRENDGHKDKLLKANLTETKLKKSIKEKENLKMELQKLKKEVNNNPEKTVTQIKKNELQKEVIKEENEIISHANTDLNIANKIIPEINSNFESKSPINLKIFKTLTQSSYILYSIDNTFDSFTTLSGEILLVYATKFKSLECFDLVKQKFQKTILNAHNSSILIIRHYSPKYLQKDLILSGSNNPDFCIKIWDISNWSCIYNLNKIYEKGNMLAACIHFDEYQKEGFIFTSNDCGYIKIYDMEGKFIKNINKTQNNETFFLDTYYDNNELKYFLISGEMKCVKAYELNTHQLFRTYIDTNSFSEHLSAFVHKKGDIAELVECEFYGYIRVWNFHTGNLIKKIEICKRTPLVSMCLWNKNYLFVSCVDFTIKLVDFKNYNFIKSFHGHNNEVCTIKKIFHPNHGECLLSQGLANEQIKMWINT